MLTVLMENSRSSQSPETPAPEPWVPRASDPPSEHPL